MSKQPANQNNPTTYQPGEADSKAFDISMKNEETGEVTDIDGRSELENRRASGHKE